MTDTVYFQQDTCHITLFLSKLHELPTSNLRKLFTMMLYEPWNNQDAINSTELFLSDAVAKAKEDWERAAKDRQTGWKTIEKPTRRRTRLEVQADAAVRANNEALVRAEKRAKALYGRWVRIQTFWNDTKHRMNYK